MVTLDGIDLFEVVWPYFHCQEKGREWARVSAKSIPLVYKQVQKLEIKLAELEKLKNNYENDLLEKSSLLFNKKKLKILD